MLVANFTGYNKCHTSVEIWDIILHLNVLIYKIPNYEIEYILLQLIILNISKTSDILNPLLSGNFILNFPGQHSIIFYILHFSISPYSVSLIKYCPQGL